MANDKKRNLIRKPFFYDRQIARYLTQIASCFAGYQVMTGNQRDGKHQMMDVPIIMGDWSRVSGYLLNGGSENTMQYLPVMSLTMTGFSQNAEMRQAPQHTEKYRVIERARDSEGTLLINQPGRKTTVERYMPVPYTLDFQISIWGSNKDQGLQIVEQICTVFNPDMDIQLSNALSDWTFLTTLLFEGTVEMEKAMPSGTDIDPLDIYTLSFNTNIWLSPPAKVYETKHIYEIHVPIKEIEEGLDFDEYQEIDGLIIRADEDDIITFESFN